jgi:Ca2+:H+ antiporter
LVLAIAITIIECALIVSMMLAGGATSLPRDTIFSAIMIICNGVVGLCLLVGSLRHHEQAFHIEGANTAFATIIALATLALVLPTFTTSSIGSTYTTAQLAFAGVTSLVLWGAFVFVQTVRHRDYFLPVDGADDLGVHAAPPSDRLAWASFGLLLIGLLAVVGEVPVMEARLITCAISGPCHAIGLFETNIPQLRNAPQPERFVF